MIPTVNKSGLLSLFAGALLISSSAWAEPKITVYDHANDPILKLKTIAWEGGKTVSMTVGIGSGAYRHPKDPGNVVYTVSDRGPNFTCGAAAKITGIEGERICKGVKARIYPVPSYTPSIYGLKLNDDSTFSVFEVIALKDRDGTPINGLLNPLTVAKTEIPVDGVGNELKQDASAVDAEGLIKLSDGTWWIGEENGPSILHVAANGRILKRYVPEGSEKDFANANYDVVGALPAILVKRQTNRGIESMAVSEDEKTLYFMVQNPLANPNAGAYKKAKNTRFFAFDRTTERVTGEYVYTLDDPQTFRNDPSDKQNAPRISEVLGLGGERFLVLERTNKTTKLHEISLEGATNILGSNWDDLNTAPSLEQTSVADAGINPVSKTLRFDSADFPNVPVKMEGLAILGDGSLFTINDDDFGITGGRSRVVVVHDSGVKARMN